MCGIVGYIGKENAEAILLDGLKRLEYRGYDSAGLAIIDGRKVEVRRSVGKLLHLEDKVRERPIRGCIGIGHTRWATHGRPTEENAHPHIEGGVAVVHNGIIENYLTIRETLKSGGAVFKSETDTEVIAHLISREMKAGHDLGTSTREALKQVRGSYAIAVISSQEPDTLVGARMECPLVVGMGDGECYLASDVPAILHRTRRMIFLEDGEVVILNKRGMRVTTLDGKEVKKIPRVIDWSPAMAEKGGYKHFMLKEIFEQPRAITDTFRSRVSEETGDVILEGLDIKGIDTVKRIHLVACGTSWHAALVGKFFMEELTRVPSEVDLGSEFRYRDPLVDEKTLIIAISQSGETADTLAAVREGRRKGARVISICNVMESSITRESHGTIYTHAGPEIGVASTKAFTTQLVALYLLSLYLGRRLGLLSRDMGKEMVQGLVRIPKKIDGLLASSTHIEAIARRHFHYRDFLYLGRGINYPIALEGALKLKEISYIHAEGYPAGEMKHGPIALIDEDMPVVVLAPKDRTYAKVLGNMEEVRARGGRIIAIVNEGDKEAVRLADEAFFIPTTTHYLNPILLTVPLQLLAYHIAVLKGTDVDQPRNLAKSVTVE